MAQFFILFLMALTPLFAVAQIPGDYPDTLWLYGPAENKGYGLSIDDPIKVGGGYFPKNNYRYVNNLVDLEGNRVEFERLGSISSKSGGKPLTGFNIRPIGTKKWTTIYFEQHEWDYPKLIKGFGWKEERRGYHGEFATDSSFNGFGLYFFSDGGYYKGQWKDGLMSGEGILFVPGTEMYTGSFKNGKYEGYGVLDFLDGGHYEGLWADGEKNGSGKVFYPPGDDINYIEGNYKAGNAVGVHTIYFANGTTELHDFDKQE